MAPEEPWTAVYLSPHLDDAAFSCGGQIVRRARDGQRVLVVTVMAGDGPTGELSPLAHELHALWNLGADAVANRRREDREACRALGCELLHWSFPDAAYRRDRESGRPLYPTLSSLFGPPAPQDLELVDQLTAALRRLVGPTAPPAAVHPPLAAGRHVDHRLVRWAAEAAFGDDLSYYEDYPYARRKRVVKKALGRRRDWEARVWPLEPADVEARIRAMACYRSQLGAAFADVEDMARQVRRHIRRVGGERLWRWRDASPRRPERSP